MEELKSLTALKGLIAQWRKDGSYHKSASDVYANKEPDAVITCAVATRILGDRCLNSAQDLENIIPILEWELSKLKPKDLY